MDENDPLFWQILLQMVLIVMNAVFACAEIAVISINDNKLARLSEAGDKRAKRLVSLTKNPARFLATIQVGITLAGFLGSAFAADNFSGRMVHWLISIGVNLSPAMLDVISVVFITLVLSFFTLVLGELVPKRIAMKKAETLGLAMSGLIYFVSQLFAPLVWTLTFSTNTLLRLIGIDPDSADSEVTEEEIRMMVDVGSEKGAIQDEEKQIIHNVFEFNNKTVSEIMTHRTELTLLWLKDGVEQWNQTIIESKFAHYPLCDEIPDNVVGVLYAKEYFRLNERTREAIMEIAVHPVHFIPETLRADILFQKMKESRNHFAVVLDEYGGMNGIVTMNDLLEQLVGDLEDDMTEPLEPPLIEKLDDQTWAIRGTAPLEQVEKALGVPLPVDKFDTFSGMVFGIMGSIPGDGETPELEKYGLHIYAKKIKDHHLEIAHIVKDDKEISRK